MKLKISTMVALLSITLLYSFNSFAGQNALIDADYENHTVDFQNTVKESLMAVELDADEYAYEFVSGLPGIRYPVAVVFDQKEAKYIIPAQLATVGAFEEGSEKMQYIASPSNESDTHKNSQNAFPVYHFQDVAKASRSSSAFGLGGGIGISPTNIGDYSIPIATLAIGVLGVGIVVTKKLIKGKNNSLFRAL